MIYNSLSFFIYLPTVFVLYWFLFYKKVKYQNSFLLFASYLFYGLWKRGSRVGEFGVSWYPVAQRLIVSRFDDYSTWTLGLLWGVGFVFQPVSLILLSWSRLLKCLKLTSLGPVGFTTVSFSRGGLDIPVVFTNNLIFKPRP